MTMFEIVCGLAGVKPEISLKSVDLPDPEGPTTATVLPGAMLKSIPLSMSRLES